MIPLLTALLTASAGDEPAWKSPGFGFGGLPAVNYNTDEGLGLGAVASVYRYDGSTSPYKVAITGIFFMTTRGVHGHRLDVDALKLLDGRLRLTTRLGLEITKTNNFCGFGPDVTCDPANAEARADALGLVDAEREQFVRRYHLASFIRPNLFVNARWRLGDSEEVNLELMTSLRSELHLPGDFSSPNPDPDNLISARLDREKGLMNIVQVGLMADTRDFESAPSRGWWVEASVRGSARALASDFDYFGVNTTLRGYLPLVGEGVLVGAGRVALDGMVGDVPIREMSQMGGSVLYTFGGGLNAGRGVRQRRYIGRAKGLVQPELRWRFARIEPLGVKVDFTLLAFADLMFVAEDWNTLDQLARPVLSEGGGLRLAFDDNFIIRTDVGVSAVEGYSPAVYIDLAHLF